MELFLFWDWEIFLEESEYFVTNLVDLKLQFFH